MGSLREYLRHVIRSMGADSVELPPASAPGYFNRWEAESRSHRLLIDNLTDNQRATFLSRGYFDVVGGDTGKRYRIKNDWQMNVEEFDGSVRRTKLMCFTPKGGLPLGDMILAQKVALELFETEALIVANRGALLEADEAFPFVRR
jgi:hypothetical protein